MEADAAMLLAKFCRVLPEMQSYYGRCVARTRGNILYFLVCEANKQTAEQQQFLETCWFISFFKERTN